MTPGALALGSTLAVTALITGQILILPLIGIIFVIETLSVILQVAYFKLTGGKRIFRMSPLHHHFELGGWDEEKITIRFWIVGIIAALLGRHLLLRLDQSARGERDDRASAGDRSDALDDGRRSAAGALRGRPVTVLGFARSGIALARFLADAGARVTVYDGRPAEELAGAIAALEGRTVRLAARARCGPRRNVGGRGARDHVALDQPGLPDDGATAAGGAAGTRGRAGRQGIRGARPRLGARPVPAPLPGADGRGDRDEGQDDDASLTAALLAGDPDHPVVLGGNIGVPIVERLPELTPDHRVVYELSELQLPTLSRGTTVAVYTNVTEDHLDRHGSLEAYRLVKRRLAELVDPDGALVLNAEDPVVAATPISGPRRPSATGSIGRCPAGSAWSTAGSSRPGWSGCRCRRRRGGDRAGRPDHADRRAARSRARHNVSNALAAVAVALLFGVAPDAIRRAAAGVQRRRASSRAGGDRRRRAVRQRLAGDAAGRGGGRVACVRRRRSC